MPKKSANKSDDKSKSKKEAMTNKDDNDDDDDEDDEDDEPKILKPFSLGRSAKLAGFTFLAFILLMSDVFVLRIMDRANMDLVSGRCPTKKGLIAQGVLLAFAMIVFDFLITKEKL
jgi:hypothetical protein